MLERLLKYFGLLMGVAIFFCGCASHPPAPILNQAQAVRDADYYRIPSSFQGQVRLDLPASNTGQGKHDFYNLFAEYHKGKTVTYGIVLASTVRLASDDATMLVNGVGPLPITSTEELPIPFFRKVQQLEIRFDRDFVEKSTITGRYFTLRSQLRTYEFQVPDWMFAALLQALDQRLPDLRSMSYNVTEVMTRTEIRQQHVNDHPELSAFMQEAIMDGEVAQGMTMKDVRATWGEPEIVQHGKGAEAGSVIWRYPGVRLVLKQGVVTGWQEE